MNPYESPSSVSQSSDNKSAEVASRNVMASVGWNCSLLSFVGLLFSGPAAELSRSNPWCIVLLCIPFISLPGMALSFLGLFRRPRDSAGWGLFLSFYVALHLSTTWIAIKSIIGR